MSDQPLHMWSYWRDKKGIVEAITDYYPATMQMPEVMLAIAQIKMAEAAINGIMSKLEEEADGCE